MTMPKGEGNDGVIGEFQGTDLAPATRRMKERHDERRTSSIEHRKTQPDVGAHNLWLQLVVLCVCLQQAMCVGMHCETSLDRPSKKEKTNDLAHKENRHLYY